MKKRRLAGFLAVVLMFVMIAVQLPAEVFAADPTLKATKKTLYVGGDNYKLTFKNLASGATVTYKSSNTKIAKVTKKGVVKPVAAGSATITATIKQAKKTYTSKIAITVKTPFIKITNPITSLEAGKTYKLEASTGGLKQVEVIWKSSNTKVAKVNSKTRVLTAVAEGTAKISVKDNISGKSNTFTLTVIKAAPTATPTPTPEPVEYGENDDFGYEISKKGITITDVYDSEATSLTIPSKIDGKSVIGLGDGVFSGMSELKKVSLPSTLTTIGEGAFSYCESLTSVTIPASVTEVGANTFEYCESLSSITIPKSIKRISEGMFVECTSLKTVKLSSGVEVIGEAAFEGCVALSTLTLSDTLTTIEPYAFECCEALKTVKFPASMRSIGEEAFLDCIALKTVTFEKGLKEIQDYAFNGCLAIASITLPDTLTYLGAGAFEYCEALKTVTIPASVTEIGGGAFDGCSESLKLKIKKNSVGYEYAVENEIPYNTY
ncbi:MAG: leucine-rich repeat protein [Lachnospiraceae bacterium]|nr:leucine-rich repeat protein [Lachnospiraceae bacterium]